MLLALVADLLLAGAERAADPVGPAGAVVSVFSDAVVYLNDPFNWTRTNGILDLLRPAPAHLGDRASLVAMVIAHPGRRAAGHTGRGGGFTVALSNVSRAMPTLALLTVFAVTPIGFGTAGDDDRAGALRDPAGAGQHLRRVPRGRPRTSWRRRGRWG